MTFPATSLPKLLPTLLACALLAGSLPGCQAPRNAPTKANDVSRLERLKAEFAADPDNLELAIALAEAYRDNKEPKQAEALYQQFLSGGNEAAQGLAMNALAQHLEKEGQVDEAIDWLLRSTGTGITETQSHAWFLLAELVKRVGTVPDRLKQPVREGEPPLAPEGGGVPETVAAAYRKAIALGNAAPPVFKGLAELQIEAGELRGALENYRIYLAGDSGDYDGWLKAASLAAELGDLESARFYLQMVASKGNQEQRMKATEALEKIAAAG